ncbi:hypothetical protein E2C01_065502 [Portunus trituberculatus]|uniref:Uncharacterized protein n=1 Tax=Portunus trituberculatus TaxID=210409 RepID=A0A5B7HFR5_PORTR|nr:hypothetical protein [Portunus trituberculatus]
MTKPKQGYEAVYAMLEIGRERENMHAHSIIGSTSAMRCGHLTLGKYTAGVDDVWSSQRLRPVGTTMERRGKGVRGGWMMDDVRGEGSTRRMNGKKPS